MLRLTPLLLLLTSLQAGTPQSRIDQLVAESLNPGEIETVKPLLDAGAIDINARDQSGLTALQAARLKGHAELAAFLISRGADPNLQRPTPKELTDAQFTRLISPTSPGLAVLVARDGKVLFEKGYGLADIEHQIPVKPRTLFRIGSVSKQFTAAAILQLQEEGKLSVTDKLSKYLSDYPHGTEVSIAHLLSHTSGIHNYTENPDFMDTVNQPVSTLGLVNMFRNYPLDFVPGTQWYYSNSNYVLLAAIIEKVSGLSYSDYLRTHLLAPLGLKHTGVYRAGSRLAHIAQGYEYLDGKVIPAVSWDMSRALGVGAMYSTVEDLFRWNEALFHGKVLNPASLASAFKPVTTGENSPTPADSGSGYGYGFFLSSLRGSPEVQHGGSMHGYSSFLLRLPRQNFTVVVLANSLPCGPGVDTSRLAHDTAEFYLGESLPPRPANKVNPNVSLQALDAISGRYDYGPALLTVSIEGGRAYAELAGQPRLEIFPKSETDFFWKGSDARLKFVKDASGKIIRAIEYQDGYAIYASRLATLDASSLDAILGSYDCSRRGESILTISSEGGRVFARLTGQLSYEIYPRSATEFYWKGGSAGVIFVKDAAGRVTKAIQRQNGITIEAPKIQ